MTIAIGCDKVLIMPEQKDNLMGGDPNRNEREITPPKNLSLAMGKMTLLIRSISARQGYEVSPHFSRVYTIDSWAQLDKAIAHDPSMLKDPDALIMIHGGINKKAVKFAGTVAIHGGINEGTIDAKRIITHDPSIGWGQIDHSGSASGKANTSGEGEQRLLDESFAAAFPSPEFPQRRQIEADAPQAQGKSDELPSEDEAVNLAEEFLRKQNGTE